MPIRLKHPVQPLAENEFRELDYCVMGIAFDIHNDFGRHLDEEVYERELALRLTAAGVTVEQQFHMTLDYQGFSTTLYADLLIGGSTLYELKRSAGLAAAHRAQLLTYVLLTGTHHGKLLNFGAQRVEGEYVSTTLDARARREFCVDDGAWQDVSPSSESLRKIVFALVEDWGLFLNSVLYRDAIIHCLGGVSAVFKRTDLSFEGRRIGQHDFHLLDNEIPFVISTLSDQIAAAETHYRQLLSLSAFRALHWINLRKHTVEFRTLLARH